MIDGFDEPRVRAMASGLVVVRNLMRGRRAVNGTTSENKVLDRIADHAAFAALGPTSVSRRDRGRWIAERVRLRLSQLEADAIAVGADDASARAVRGWARLVEDGLTPAELFFAHPELVHRSTPTDNHVKARNSVQHLLWAGGARGDVDARTGVQHMADELRSALSTRLPGAGGVDATVFGYEWHRLRAANPSGCVLLAVLGRLAPGQPFPPSLLREAGDCLPEPLAAVCGRPRELRALSTALEDRGLLTVDGDRIVIDETVGVHVIAQASPAQQAHLTAAALRFLTHALRADTHHPDSSDEWIVATPHVQAACARAQEAEVSLGDVVYLLDRLSVHLREGRHDADAATAVAKQAVTLSTSLGPNDDELHSNCLGNLALAHLAAGRRKKAEKWSGRGLDALAATLGERSESYTESLNVHASILAARGRWKAADKAHARALATARQLYATSPEPHLRELLVQTLNDFAAQLLSTPGARRAQRGRELLGEANRLVRRGGPGWTQIELNLGRAHRAAGDLRTALQHFQEVRDHCASRPPSLTLVDALASLAEVYEELGDPRAAETLREAHRVDNALVAESEPGRERSTT